MGGFFNKVVMNRRIIPNIYRKGDSLEEARRKFNVEVVRSEKEEQGRIEYTDGASEPESKPAVPVNEEYRPKSVRRTHKKRTRQTRSDKGVRRSSDTG